MGSLNLAVWPSLHVQLVVTLNMEEPRLDEKEFRRKLISGAKWAASLRLLAQLFSWIVNIAIVRFLLPEDYGLNAMLEVPIELLMLFSTLGLDLALVRQRQRSNEELTAAFGLLLVINITFFLGLVLGAPSIASYFKDPRLVPLIQVAAAIFLLLPFRAIPDALLDRELAFKLKSQVDLTATVTASIVSLIMAMMGVGVWALVTALVGGAMLRVILLAYLKPWLVVPSFRFGLVRDLVRVGGIMTLSGMLVVLAGRAVNLIAGPVLGAEYLGYFALAAGFALMPLSKIMPIVQQVMYPAFSRLEKEPEYAIAYLLRSMEITSLLIFPLSVGLACVADSFVEIVFGQKWTPAAGPMATLSLAIPFRMMVAVSTPALNALGHMARVFQIYLLMFSVLVLGTPLAVLWGVNGVVVLWLFATLVTALFAITTLCIKIRVPFIGLVKAIKPASIGSIIMALAVTLFNLMIDKVTIAYLVSGILIGALCYMFAIRILFADVYKMVRNIVVSPSQVKIGN